MIELDHAKEAWDKLKAEHESRDPARVQILWNTFNTIVQLREGSIADYISRIKSVSKQLHAPGDVIATSQLINRIIQGLRSEFYAVRSSLALIDNLTEDRLSKILLREEARLILQERERKGRSRSRERDTRSRERDRRYRSRSTDYRRDKKRNRSPSPRPRKHSCSPSNGRKRSASPSKGRNLRDRYCTSCKRFGHTVDNCFYLHPELLDRRRQEAETRTN